MAGLSLAIEATMIRQQQPDSAGQGRLQMAQIIAQLSVFLLELGHPQLSLGRLRQQLLGRIILAGKRKFVRGLGCWHWVEK